MKIVRNLIVGICAVLSFTITSCNSGDDVPDQLDRWYEEVAIIDNDLDAAGTPHIKDPESGIRMVITKLGTNLPGQKYNTVDVDYVGRRYEDKGIFDDGNTKLQLKDYIQGWQIALSKLPAGSEAKIIIPSLYGYGTAGSGSTIPPNTILEFDVKFNSATMSSGEASRFTTDTTAIDQYLSTKGINATKDTTGLRYVITTPGSGPTATWFSKVSMKYTIKLMSDDTDPLVSLERYPSDTYYSRPVDYIHGMMIGLQRLSVGSKAVFYIPSGFAFGADGVSDPVSGVSIPANSNIIIEVDILNIQ
jgi:FKBP-type peptidyl-prolyl cis-trans isomerase